MCLPLNRNWGCEIASAHSKHTTHPNTTHPNTSQHSSTQHNTTQHITSHPNTTQHNTTHPNTTQHNTTQHNTAQLNLAFVSCLNQSPIDRHLRVTCTISATRPPPLLSSTAHTTSPHSSSSSKTAMMMVVKATGVTTCGCCRRGERTLHCSVETPMLQRKWRQKSAAAVGQPVAVYCRGPPLLPLQRLQGAQSERSQRSDTFSCLVAFVNYTHTKAKTYCLSLTVEGAWMAWVKCSGWHGLPCSLQAWPLPLSFCALIQSN